MRNRWNWCSQRRCWFTLIDGITILADTYLGKLDEYDWSVKIIPRANGAEFKTIATYTDRRYLYLTRHIMDADDGDIIVRRDVSDDNVFDARFANLSLYAWDRPAGYSDPTVIR